MKYLLIIVCLLFNMNSKCQYYYNDIVFTNQLNSRVQNYQIKNVKSIQSFGYDENGIKTNDFWETQSISKNNIKISTYDVGYLKWVNLVFTQNKISEEIDSSTSTISKTSYEYDSKGKLIQVTNKVNFLDSANEYFVIEEHQYLYDLNGMLQSMRRIINNTDTLQIKFLNNEKGSPIEEKVIRNGNAYSSIYYYFDEKERLTDVVRYNETVKKLLPDFMFEYDENNNVIQKIAIMQNNQVKYLIWRYAFNEKGLKN